MLQENISQSARQNFQKNNAGILFNDVSAQRIKLALKLAENNLKNFEYLIWIAPANFLKTLIYTNEIKKNSQNFKHRIKYFAIESISVSDTKYLDLFNIIQTHKTFCIIDNSLTIKNIRSDKTQRLLLLSRYFTYKIILSDTSVSKDLLDLYAQLEFLSSKILRMNEKQFHHIFLTDTYQNYMIIKRWSCAQDENNLLKLIKPYILGYKTNKNYIIHHQNYYFKLTAREELCYQNEKLNFLEHKNRIVFMDLVQNFQKYYTIAQNKFDGLKKVLQEIFKRKEKVIIYFRFIDEIDILKELNILPPESFVEVSGRTNKKQAIKAFEHKKNIMLCTYGVEKFNLDIHVCNNVIHFSQTFNYRYKQQSVDSAVFKGVPHNLNIYDFWLNTNLELLIKDSLEHKKNLIAGLHKKITKAEAIKL